MSEFKPKVWMRCPLCREQSPMPDPDVREWVALTDEELSEIIDREIGFNSCWGPEETFARAIEAALRSKNT